MAQDVLILRGTFERCFPHLDYDEFISRPPQRQRTFLNLPWNRRAIEQASKPVLF